MARTLQRPRPEQGARLASLRHAAGLTQKDLAEAIGITQANIAFWELSDKPPRSDVLPKLARALRVSVATLLGEEEATPRAARHPGPVSRVDQLFEDVRRLPRKQQTKIVDVVSALLDQYKKKAS